MWTRKFGSRKPRCPDGQCGLQIDTVGFDKRVDVNEDRVNDGNKYSGLKSKDEWEVIRAEAVKDPEEVIREKAQRIKDADDAARLKAEFERKVRCSSSTRALGACWLCKPRQANALAHRGGRGAPTQRRSHCHVRTAKP